MFNLFRLLSDSNHLKIKSKTAKAKTFPDLRLEGRRGLVKHKYCPQNYRKEKKNVCIHANAGRTYIHVRKNKTL